MGRKVAVSLVAGLALVAAPAALGAPGGIGPPTPETDSGEAISQLYWFVFGICAFVFVAVETALILFVIRFRRRRATHDDVEGPQIHGNTRLEIIWTIIPAVILVAIAVVVFIRVPAVEATGGGGDELRVRVDAHQFYWQYRYPSGVVSLDTLVLPVGRRVTLDLTSLDVDHSWWVPQLTGKKDALPGRTTTLRFRPKTEGTYEGHCAELCGILHAIMPTEVQVVSAQEFQGWIAARQRSQGAGNQAAGLGRETWEHVCAKCHGLDGEGDIGPSIQANGTLTNRQALRDLLETGQDTPQFSGYMPPVGRGWPTFQLEALMAYIQSNAKLAGEQAGAQSGG
jgi:cytochrome c oxidase subunit II